MSTYRKKPVVVEASQWHGHGDHEAVRCWVPPHSPAAGSGCVCCDRQVGDHGWVVTPGWGRTVCPGDWIITDVNGGVYPCKPDVFPTIYERVMATEAPHQ